MSPAAGKIVLSGRYRLVEPLATGGMGTVWRAYDDVLDRPVAVKEVLLPPGLDDEAREVLRQRTLREARAAAKLRHAAIVTVFDVVEQDGRPWIVMELVPSQSLEQRIRTRGALPPSEAAAVGLRILDALVTAQAAGVQHRDIKPANVLLADDGRVVLTDFGIARHVGDQTLTSAGLLVGSPNYLAPERARGLPTPGLQSDLWSLGATLYAAVEGQPPFERNGPLPTLAAVVMDEPPPPQRAGPLRPVIDGLLVKDPRYRLDAERTRAMLQQVLRPGTAGLRAGPAPRPAPDPTRPLPVTPKPPPAPATPPPAGARPPAPPAPAAAPAGATAATDVAAQDRPAGEETPGKPAAGAAAAVAGVVAAAGAAAAGVKARAGADQGAETSRPASDRPAASAPAADGPPTSRPGTSTPTAAGGKTSGRPAASDVAAAAPPSGAAVAGGTATSGTPATEPAADDPTTDDPTTDDPTTDDPTTDDPAPSGTTPGTATGGTAKVPAGVAPGTRTVHLDRPTGRPTLLLAGAAVVLVILAAVLLPQFLDERDPATPTPTAAPTAGTAAPTGGAASARPSGAPSGATTAPGTAPANRPAPTTAPAPGGVAVPAGFTRYVDPTRRFQVAVPAGWTAGPGRTAPQVRFDDPTSDRYLLIETSDTPQSDPYTNWVEYERTFSASRSDYENLGIDRVSYGADKGWQTADWEFRIGGTHVLNRNVLVSSRRAHAIYWSTPESMWSSAESRRIFQVAADTFVPAPVA